MVTNVLQARLLIGFCGNLCKTVVELPEAPAIRYPQLCTPHLPQAGSISVFTCLRLHGPWYLSLPRWGSQEVEPKCISHHLKKIGESGWLEKSPSYKVFAH